MDYTFNWAPVLQSLGALASGLAVTLQVFALSSVGATVLGLGGAGAMLSSRPAIRGLATAYVELMRNSPSLVKMYFIYFGLPTFGLFPSAFWAGTAALIFHNAAYMMDVFRAAFASIEKGQREASASLGLNKAVTYYKILLPQAFRRALPGIGNYWAEMVKDTSLTSALSVQELFFVFNSQIALNMRTYEFFFVAGAIYLLLTSGVSGAPRLVNATSRAVRSVHHD